MGLDMIAKDEIGSNLSDILTSLGEDELQDDEKLKLLEEVLEFFQRQQYEYDKTIEFEDDDSLVKDYLLARSVLLDSLDKTKIISDITMQMLAANPQNILLFETLQENMKLAQQSAKSLIDLHNSFSRNRKGILSNKKLVADVSNVEEDDLEEKLREAGVLFK